jgi:hypothetical protein
MPYRIIGAIVAAIAIVVALLFMRRRRAPRPVEGFLPLPTVVPPSPAAVQSPPASSASTVVLRRERPPLCAPGAVRNSDLCNKRLSREYKLLICLGCIEQLTEMLSR